MSPSEPGPTSTDPKAADSPVELPPTTPPAPSATAPADREPAKPQAPPTPPAPPRRRDQAARPQPVPEKPADTPTASQDDWRDGLTRVRRFALLRAGEPGDAAEAWKIRSRVLDWLAGEGPEPSGETGRVWNSVLATLSTATGPETADEPTLASHLGAAVDALEVVRPAPDHRPELLPEDRRVRALRTRSRPPRSARASPCSSIARWPASATSRTTTGSARGSRRGSRCVAGRGGRRRLVGGARDRRGRLPAPPPRLLRQLPDRHPPPALTWGLHPPPLTDGHGLAPRHLRRRAVYRQAVRAWRPGVETGAETGTQLVSPFWRRNGDVETKRGRNQY